MPKTLLNPKYTLTGDSDWHLDDPVPLATRSSAPEPLRLALCSVVSFGGGMALVLGFQLVFGQHQARSAVPPSPQPPIYGPVEGIIAEPAVPSRPGMAQAPPPATGIVTVELDGNVVREVSLAPHFPALVRFPSAIAKLHNHNGESFRVTSDHPAELVIEVLVPRQPTPMTPTGAVWVELTTGEIVVLHLSQVAPDEVVLGETTDMLIFTWPAATGSGKPAQPGVAYRAEPDRQPIPIEKE